MKSLRKLVLCCFLLVSCSNPYIEYQNQLDQAKQAQKQNAEAINAFDPSKIESFSYEIVAGPDKNIGTRIIKAFDSAQKSIDFNMYLLTRTDMVDALVRAQKRWVKVRVIIEKTVYQMPRINNKAYDTLLAAGVEVQWADEKRFNFNHAKYFIADDTMMIATGNMTKSSFEKNREFFVFSTDPRLRAMLEKIFETDIANATLDTSFPELYISPSDSRPKIQKLLSGATKSIYFYSESLSDNTILDILAKKRAEWLDVKVCLSKQKGASFETKIADRLKLANIPLTHASGPYVHAKSFLVDGSILAIGSINFTTNSLNNNREVGILLRNSPFLPSYLSIVNKDCVFP